MQILLGLASPGAQWKGGWGFLGYLAVPLAQSPLKVSPPLVLGAFALVTFAKHHLMAEVFWAPL